jgi:crotonobetainyl-CoA:carnitine CoA-transferase CaiB-like acyl-CoA transferase
LVEVFTRFEVPHAPILGVLEALSQPQAQDREMVVEVEHPALGRIPMVNRSIKFDEKQPTPTPPPVLGEDTEAILSDVLGLDAERIVELRRMGVVA